MKKIAMLVVVLSSFFMVIANNAVNADMVDFALVDEQAVGGTALTTCPSNQIDPCYVEIPMASGLTIICIYPRIDFNQCEELSLVAGDVIFVTGKMDRFQGNIVLFAEKIYKR